MSLWNIIRDFFVCNIFGGTPSSGIPAPTQLGSVYYSDFDFENLSLNDVVLNMGNLVDGSPWGLSIADYLSTTFTIITFLLLFIVACLFVRWCFRVFKGAFKW